ncbi:hypothetical protein Halha_0938 [Halobacteroides halobius DSM 5150]|uniref:Uncharacterized protein n=1 Tax=Halobacteroides halobius (strain ATCC 35273 / DSM 5150 / MD-1) TaxID=748449 RepID=L0K973_HALHC|nr:hypothetical protein [Halobacteroides halobius]AGB40899.1 hypothetical protein Halha_0938 [Halobacteroides halobius DSM 5150]
MINQQLLQKVAQNCPEYDPIANAQGYGISWLNNPESLDKIECDLCVNWQEGACHIFQDHKEKY